MKDSDQKRRRDLEASIIDTLDLIKGYEDKRRLSDDPKEKMDCERQIADQRQLLEGYKVELKRLEVTNIEMPPDTQLSTQIKMSLAKLPSPNSALFGRQKELEALDAAWANPKTNLITLVAFGGMGKTALVNAWLNHMRDDNFGGAERVFGWSFYSQGASEGKQVSADVFIASALDWFDDPEPDKGSPWDKGERLAELIQKQKTLLILDGFEPLQNPPGEGEGRIKDPSLKSLLMALAHHNPGLCVITTRIEVDDIKDDNELQETLGAIGDNINEIRQQNIFSSDSHLPRDIENISEVVDVAKLDVSHKLKVTIPIIPFILSYEGEMALNSGMNLESALKKLLNKVRGKQ